MAVCDNGHAHNGVHRRSDIVAHSGKEVSLGIVRTPCVLVSVTERSVCLQELFGVLIVLVLGYLLLFGNSIGNILNKSDNVLV